MTEHPWFDLQQFHTDAQNYQKDLDTKKKKEYVEPIMQAVQEVEQEFEHPVVVMQNLKSSTRERASLRFEPRPLLTAEGAPYAGGWPRLYITPDDVQIRLQFPDGPKTYATDFLRHALHDPNFFQRFEDCLATQSPAGMTVTTRATEDVPCTPQARSDIQALLKAYRDSYGESSRLVAHVFHPLQVLEDREHFKKVYQHALHFMNQFGPLLLEAFQYPAPENPEVHMPPEIPAVKPTLARGPENLILYGPPGTGKTHRTAEEVVRLLDPVFLQGLASLPGQERRKQLKQRFDDLQQQGRVGFVTFHQSFSYEDFVEGIRAKTVDGQIQYTEEKGVFTDLALRAFSNLKGEQDLGVRPDARVWKISIDKAGPSKTRGHCLEKGEVRVGWREVGSFIAEDRTEEEEAQYQNLGSNTRKTIHYFAEGMQVGDVVLCLSSKTTVQAVGVVTGEYQHEDAAPEGVHQDFVNVRKVHWWVKNIQLDITTLNRNAELSQVTLYPLSKMNVTGLLDHLQQLGHLKPEATEPLQYALVIDEINRGNISRIFGELITLLEPSKRYGSQEALMVKLPYSKRDFVVPPNLHVIGTMNTADKSLARLDIALRRRFKFIEVAPEPHLLQILQVGEVDIDLRRFLHVINKRIELLFDRDHTLGHAYLMHLGEDSTIDDLADTMQNRILPLLQEYFFDNWGNIQKVLKGNGASAQEQFVVESTDEGNTWLGEGRPIKTYQVNEKALLNPLSYTRIYEGIDLKLFGLL